MTDRTAFQAWYKEHGSCRRSDAFGQYQDPDEPKNWIYLERAVDEAWYIWQAAIKQERQACAKECDEMPQRLGIHCARAIRARSEG